MSTRASHRPAAPRRAFRRALALGVAAALALLWLSLGVGIIGRDGDPANRVYLAVLAVGVAGSLGVRLRPRGMAWVMFAMALLQAAIGVVAAATGLGLPWSGPAEVLLLNGFFAACFAAAGVLFRRAARAAAALPG